jgi:hypothetical protein
MSSSPCARMLHRARMRDQSGRVRARLTLSLGPSGARGTSSTGRARRGSRARTLGPLSVRRRARSGPSPARPPSRRRSPRDPGRDESPSSAPSAGARLHWRLGLQRSVRSVGRQTRSRVHPPDDDECNRPPSVVRQSILAPGTVHRPNWLTHSAPTMSGRKCGLRRPAGILKWQRRI